MLEPIFKHIVYEFDPAAVLGDIDTREYDVQSSSVRFMELCDAALRREYPGTSITIAKAFGTRYLVDGLSEHSETPRVEEICLKVWVDQDYLVRSVPSDTLESTQLITIRKTSDEFNVTVGILRWGCTNKLIVGASCDGLIWMFSKAGFLDFQRAFFKGNLYSLVWRIRLLGDKVSSITGIEHTDFLKQNAAEMIQDDTVILIDPSACTLPQPFDSANAYILLTSNKGQRKITVVVFDDVEQWQHISGYGFPKFKNTFSRRAKSKGYQIHEVFETDHERQQSHSIEVHFLIHAEQQEYISNVLEQSILKLQQIMEDTEIVLANGLPWDTRYELSESTFRDEYLMKLLELLEFEVVKRSHGQFEFGKDIIFAETSKFGIRRYYALQAKKGDLSGDSKGDMDTILTQLEDAFAVPFRESQTGEHKFISAFVIAVSGEFTYHAQEKIWARLLRQGRIGMVYLWDKNVVQDLMRMSLLRDNNVAERLQKSMMPSFLDTL
jgi:hypothetical protein